MKNPELINCINESKFKNLILHVANSNQVPFDMPLIYFLAAFDAAIIEKFEVVAQTNEKMPLFLLPIADPGERKTGTMSVAKAPLIEWVESQNKRESEHIKDKVQLDHLKRKKNQLHNQALKVSSIEAKEIFDEIAEIENDINKSFKKCRIFSNDATPSAEKKILSENDGRICYMETEGTFLSNLMEKGSDPQLYNHAYDGDEYYMDRITGKRSIYLAKPLISLCISAQPQPVLDFVRNKRLSGCGFLGRFIFIRLPRMAGRREISTPPIPQECIDWYRNKIFSLLNIMTQKDDAGKNVPFLLKFDHKAASQRDTFRQKVESELNPGGCLFFGNKWGWGSKLVGKIDRMSALLHCIEHDNPMEHDISEETMCQAIMMADVFTHHAQNIYFLAEHGKHAECARDILNWAFKNGDEFSFSATDAKNASGKYSLKEIRQGIEFLINRGHATINMFYFADQQKLGKKGRNKSDMYALINKNTRIQIDHDF
ncbi:MAG: DUF3987 domain-containing protein [Desulfobacteraceae bacterium]|nr:MAG: DUF3987 domain-containing protein [Desulfobacteraceae bacterium]